MLPNPGYFGTIPGTTMAGPGPSGGSLPPAGNVNGTGIIVDSLDPVRIKLELQAQEFVGSTKPSIYSSTMFTPGATLDLSEKELLGRVVTKDVLDGTSGPYKTFNKTDLITRHLDCRVVLARGGSPASSFSPDVRSTLPFRTYLAKFP